MELAKFIPPEIRLEIAQDVVREVGIRPLARKLDVNPKSVYKYKRGTSHPGDEIMTKILAVAEGEDSISLNGYLRRLREDFSRALEEKIEPEEVLSPEETSPTGPSAQRAETTEEEPVDQKPTEPPGGTPVDEQPTEETAEEVSLNEVHEALGVSNPFAQSKAEKLIGALEESPNSNMEEIMDMSGLSDDAVEKYLELLESHDFVESTPEGNWHLLVEISEAG